MPENYRRNRDLMKKLRRNDRYNQKRLHMQLAKLQTECNSWGLKLTYSFEELPPIKRKRGYLPQDRDHYGALNDSCPRCKQRIRIYYLFHQPPEDQPWHKVTEFQCGRCGREWRVIDNTFD